MLQLNGPSQTPMENTAPKVTYDPRWFIWTIVFLIVSGVSLASYIIITSSNDASQPLDFITLHRKAPAK